MTVIVVANRSTVLADDAIATAVPALATQATRDLCPAWGIAAPTVTFQPGRGPIPVAAWQLLILDNADQAGALGYHDVTASGQPLSKVFAATDLHYGAQWTVTASHELCEMIVDPDIIRASEGPAGFYALEVGDPVEADRFGYRIGSTLVSDFVLPAWFEPTHRGAPVDFGRHLLVPHTLTPGGYMSVYQPGRGWVQHTADAAPSTRAQVGSRRERRRTPRDQWLPSTVADDGQS